jgi:hypothetical protein
MGPEMAPQTETPTATTSSAPAATLPASPPPTTEAMAPTITVNPNLHATNPESVKLASGDEPTLVEFFAFW